MTDSGHLSKAPIGIFRQVESATHDDQTRARLTRHGATAGQIQTLIDGGDV